MPMNSFHWSRYSLMAASSISPTRMGSRGRGRAPCRDGMGGGGRRPATRSGRGGGDFPGSSLTDSYLRVGASVAAEDDVAGADGGAHGESVAARREGYQVANRSRRLTASLGRGARSPRDQPAAQARS